MADIEIKYDPIDIITSPVTVNVTGLDDTTNTIKLETPQPVKGELKTDSKGDFKGDLKSESTLILSTPQPLRTESKADLDIKPLVFDQCLTIRLAPLPPTCIKLPYHQHWGLTVFGVETFGLTVSGESRVAVVDAPKQPHVVWGDDTPQKGQHNTCAMGDDPSGDAVRIRLGR